MNINQKAAFSSSHILIPTDKFADEIRNILIDVLQEFRSAISPSIDTNINQHNELLTRKQACLLLGISLPTLSKYVEAGKLPFSRIGKKILFDKDTLLKSISKVGGSK